MSDPKNPTPNSTTHPEIGPRNPVGRAGGEVATGTIVFNQSSQHPLPPGDPIAIIKGAIAGGDTMRERVRQFREAMSPEQK